MTKTTRETELLAALSYLRFAIQAVEQEIHLAENKCNQLPQIPMTLQQAEAKQTNGFDLLNPSHPSSPSFVPEAQPAQEAAPKVRRPRAPKAKSELQGVDPLAPVGKTPVTPVASVTVQAPPASAVHVAPSEDVFGLGL